MHESITIPVFVCKEQEHTHLAIPFNMPPDTESFTLTYEYNQFQNNDVAVINGRFTERKKINIIDLTIIAPDGTQVGDSLCVKQEITISETYATTGYQPCELVPGEWQILLGVARVAPKGVKVIYKITFTPKHMRMIKGDFHTHTVRSDGALTVEELAQRAIKNGLDFLAITDHNVLHTMDVHLHLPNLTIIPGIELNDYQGHANFLGPYEPFEEPSITNSFEETIERFKSARKNGAVITINHPCNKNYGFKLDIKSLPFDCIEVWNGVMKEENLDAIRLWHNLLTTGKKIAICGGSDYHNDLYFAMFPGGPTTCVFALSRSITDILSALKQGHSYITFSPNGPSLQMTAEDSIIGDTVHFSKTKKINISISGLLAGDIVQMETAQKCLQLVEAPTSGDWQGTFIMDEPGFAYLKILRKPLTELKMQPILISNPIYFDN